MRFFVITLIVFSYQLGFWLAHIEVSRECKRLGAFYVNENVYQCSPKENSK